MISGATNESRPPNLIVLYTQITATTVPFYSTQAMLEPTSVSQNNPYKLYILSCHYIQLQRTRYVEKDAYYSFRENAWTTEVNPYLFEYKEKPERAYTF